MIARIWHGYTNFENAPVYETMLKAEIFLGIEERKIKGLKNIQLLKQKLNNEIEFLTILWFDSIGSVKEFAGEDYEKAVIYPAAKLLLLHFDERSQHYEIVI